MRYLATIEGAEQELEIEALPTAGAFQVRLGEHEFEADLRQVGPSSFSIIVGTRAFDFDVVREGEEMVVSSRGGVTRLTLEDAARRLMRSARKPRQVSGRVEMRAMMPGRVVSVLVQAGDQVEENQGVVVVEAMKMENELKSPKPGKVIEVKVVAGQTVEKGELLAVIE
jgi:biotin carboxyl carrier protein